MTFTSEPLLSAYRGATRVAGAFAPLFLAWRQRRGKEDRSRLPERLGVASFARPAGPLIWMHGASVGEGLALLPIVNRLVARGVHVLITSGTVSSARILADRLPSGATHQYIPFDSPAYVRRFFDHWRPNLAMVAESELWPNFILEARQRSVPLLLINARLSDKSYNRWRLAPRAIKALLSRIELVLTQSEEDAERLLALGAPRIRVAGNLKYDAPPPPVSALALAEMKAAIGSRPVWLAASTHPEEENAVIEAHLAVAALRPDLLTIVAPRHTERGVEIAAAAQARGLAAALRSRADPLFPNTTFYIADTMGEMGLFYRLSGLVFVGKSLSGATGGQNPIEPAKLGAAVLHGPAVGNFRDVYNAIDSADGATLVNNAEELADALETLLANPARARRLTHAAAEAVGRLCGATDNVMNAIEPYLMQMLAARP